MSPTMLAPHFALPSFVSLAIVMSGKVKRLFVFVLGHQRELTFKFVNVSLDLTVNEVCKNPTTVVLETRPILFTYSLPNVTSTSNKTPPHFESGSTQFYRVLSSL
jgi:hypothetical protein